IGLKEVNKCRKHDDQAQLKPEERYQLVKGTHEPIVDGAVFQRVQALRKRNGRTHHSFAETTRHVYLLGNERVRCGECRSVMTTSWSKGRRRTYPYYLCTAIDKAGTRSCGIRRVSAEALDGIVLRRVRRIAQSPKLCRDLVASTNRLFVKELGPLRQRRAALTRALGEVDSQAKQLVTKLVSNGCENLYYVREALADFEERRKQVELEIATVETAIQQYEGKQIEPEAVQHGLAAFDQVLDELTPAERRRVFELLVREVVYTPTHITLTLYELPFVERGDVKASWFDGRQEWLAD
ncbi:MAG: recombinase zinc beta ribbon domain-containing protein, partial [Candidatus Omnitrophica bacterium]|nr:recombinase zinc beta ribbon domain-containing protein [Candidatus Omnitrophota bacterium]